MNRINQKNTAQKSRLMINVRINVAKNLKSLIFLMHCPPALQMPIIPEITKQTQIKNAAGTKKTNGTK
jgi:hypothetical protein